MVGDTTRFIRHDNSNILARATNRGARASRSAATIEIIESHFAMRYCDVRPKIAFASLSYYKTS